MKPQPNCVLVGDTTYTPCFRHQQPISYCIHQLVCPWSTSLQHTHEHQSDWKCSVVIDKPLKIVETSGKIFFFFLNEGDMGMAWSTKNERMVSCSFVHLCFNDPLFLRFGASSHPYIPIIFKKHLYYFEKLPLHIIDLDSAKGIQSVWGSRLIWHFCCRVHPLVSAEPPGSSVVCSSISILDLSPT